MTPDEAGASTVTYFADRRRHLVSSAVFALLVILAVLLLGRPALPAIGELTGVALALVRCLLVLGGALFAVLAGATLRRGISRRPTLVLGNDRLVVSGLLRSRSVTWPEVNSVGPIGEVVTAAMTRIAPVPGPLRRFLGERYDLCLNDNSDLGVTTMMVGSSESLRESRSQVLARSRHGAL